MERAMSEYTIFTSNQTLQCSKTVIFWDLYVYSQSVMNDQPFKPPLAATYIHWHVYPALSLLFLT